MPYQQMPQFKSVPDKMFEIPQPGIGGLNLKDLEFEQEPNQSPYMLNVMYRNGAFAKRYGQEVLPVEIEDDIHAIVYFNNNVFIHAGTVIYKYEYEDGNCVSINTEMPDNRGQFIVFAQKLYYLIKDETDPSKTGLYMLGDTEFELAEITVPTLLINCRPGVTYPPSSEDSDQPNIIGDKFIHVYNGDGTAKYYIYDQHEYIDWDYPTTANPHPYKIEVDGVEQTYVTSSSPGAGQYTLVTESSAPFNGKKCIKFGTAPADGDMNVEVTWMMKPDEFETEKNQLFSCKYHESYGGSNNSCLFLAGCGESKYFYSNPYDITYYPLVNYATLGNTEEDISGFGRQYNVLIAFKPREVYSIYSYQINSSNSNLEELYGAEGFKSQLVNARIGCDCPYSIQLINNLLTWFNTKEGVCTLVSTNIQDERNIRVLSRNVERMNNFGIRGVLDYDEDPTKIQSADFDSKYFLIFPDSGMAFVWDYEISPYHFTSNGETPPSKLTWFLFDHFYVDEFLKVGKDLIYSGAHDVSRNKLVKLNMSFADLDFDEDGEPDGIESYYMTPFLQFGAIEYLKNVKNIYVQCRGDTATKIDMWYYDEDDALGEGESESESIVIGGRMWQHFEWSNFTWYIIGWASTFRRKCNLKKVQMASFLFKNNEVTRDMSITHIGLQYQVVKNIR